MRNSQRQNRIRSVVAGRQRGLTVVLEDIHDPHNVAAILRSCDAFGVQKVFCVYEQEAYVNPKHVGRSSSSSANKWLDIEIFRSTAECIAALKASGQRILTTALGGESVSIMDVDFTRTPTAVVLGNEHRGVSDQLRQASDILFQIPMRGMVQSLNVSVTAGICLYELTRQRTMTRKDVPFSAKEQTKLIEDFLHR